MSDAVWMSRALELAARGRGRTAPNPMVGAVIVRDGAVVGEGWHRAPGRAHAEVDAIGNSGGATVGATLYVNLEPCCHWGRTPPCTDAVLSAGFSRVVVGQVDPDPRVSGRGITQLRAAGLTVDVGVLEGQARALNAGYLCATELRRPRVLLKAAVSLDGKISDGFGASQWITGAEARAAGHRLRDQADAVLVGSGTLLADNPSLNTRFEGGRDALPVLLDSDLRCPADARVLSAGRRPLIFAATDAPDRALDADIERVARGPGGLDLAEVMRHLLARGLHTVLVEGGARVFRSLLDAGLADAIHLFVAPILLPGGVPWVGGAPLALVDARRFSLVSTERVGDDLALVLEGPCSAGS